MMLQMHLCLRTSADLIIGLIVPEIQTNDKDGHKLMQQKLILAELVKKFLAFYGTLFRITGFRRARHWPLS
jgi:hypothetical protein